MPVNSNICKFEQNFESLFFPIRGCVLYCQNYSGVILPNHSTKLQLNAAFGTGLFCEFYEHFWSKCTPPFYFFCFVLVILQNWCYIQNYQNLDTRRKLNLRKMFRRKPVCDVCLIYVLCPGVWEVTQKTLNHFYLSKIVLVRKIFWYFLNLRILYCVRDIGVKYLSPNLSNKTVLYSTILRSSNVNTR